MFKKENKKKKNPKKFEMNSRNPNCNITNIANGRALFFLEWDVTEYRNYSLLSENSKTNSKAPAQKKRSTRSILSSKITLFFVTNHDRRRYGKRIIPPRSFVSAPVVQSIITRARRLFSQNVLIVIIKIIILFKLQ